MSKYDKVYDWGYVDSGVIVEDVESKKRYKVENQRGWVTLIGLTDGDKVSFECLDEVDHKRFRFETP